MEGNPGAVSTCKKNAFYGFLAGRHTIRPPQVYCPTGTLILIIHEASTAEADPGMSTVIPDVGKIRNQESGICFVFMPVCASLLQTFMSNEG
jgi:hypothetical protein